MIKPLDERTLKSGLLPKNVAKNRNRDIVPSKIFSLLKIAANTVNFEGQKTVHRQNLANITNNLHT